jgi:alcohol dehydrogenase class IV
MIRPFNFSKLPQIYFGSGSVSLLAAQVKKYGSYVILVTGNSPLRNSAPGRKVFTLLEENNIKYDHYTFAGEPSPYIVDEAVRRFQDGMHSAVVSVGGGSIIDAGKAISAMLPLKRPVRDYLEGVGTREYPGVKVPFIAVPTTAGTGSEATRNAVISDVGSNGFKKSLRHDNLMPDIAVVDPDFTVSCSPDLTAASGMDCFTQLVEAYISDKASDFSDALALKAIRTVSQSLKRAFENPGDIEARSGMSFAALTSGICLANAGLGTVHGFASSVGALYRIPHGVVCGTLMAPANKITVRELRNADRNHPALIKFAALGRVFSHDESKSDEYYADHFINVLYEMASDLRLPGFDKFGIRADDADRIIALTENKNNPVRLSPEQLKEILLERIK